MPWPNPNATGPSAGQQMMASQQSSGLPQPPGAIDQMAAASQNQQLFGSGAQGSTGLPPPPTPGLPQPPQTAMSPAPGPYEQWGNNPMTVPPPNMADPNFALEKGPAAATAQLGGKWNGWNPNEKNQYGGQTIAGADPNQADYQSVQNYADEAYDYSRRYLDPQQDQQNRRIQQEMINKGVDPNSPQGQEMQKMLGMQQADANNAAAFNAMQFGQGIQNQMFGQEQQQAQLAGDMQKALWSNQLGASGQGLQKYLGDQQAKIANAQMQNQYNLGMRGMNMDYMLGASGQDLQRYGMDLQNQLGMGNLDLARNQAEHGQLQDWLGYDMGVRQYNDQQQMMQDALYNNWYSNTPIPGFNPTDPYSWGNTMMNTGADTRWWEGGAEGGFKLGF